MKKNSIILLCLLLFGGQAKAQTSPKSESLRVWMDDVTLSADGESITYVTVYEHDDLNYSAFNISFVVPKGVKIATVKAGRGTRNAIDLSVRAAETHSISCNMPDDTHIKIICTSSQNDEFYPDDESGNLVDEIFKIGLIAENSTVNGTYTIATEGVDFVLKPGTSDVPSYSPATSPSFQLIITGGQDESGIDTLIMENSNSDRYDLLGRRTTATHKGVFIQEGKKIIVKDHQ